MIDKEMLRDFGQFITVSRRIYERLVVVKGGTQFLDSEMLATLCNRAAENYDARTKLLSLLPFVTDIVDSRQTERMIAELDRLIVLTAEIVDQVRWDRLPEN